MMMSRLFPCMLIVYYMRWLLLEIQCLMNVYWRLPKYQRIATMHSKMAAVIANADTWLDCEECVELCRLAGIESEWQEAGWNTFETVLNEAAKKLNVKI